jgi:hypothetical protein
LLLENGGWAGKMEPTLSMLTGVGNTAPFLPSRMDSSLSHDRRRQGAGFRERQGKKPGLPPGFFIGAMT